MAEFKEELVINALHPEKAEVGKKYWVSNQLVDLRKYVTNDGTSLILTDIREDNTFCPFTCSNKGCYQFLYPYEEPLKKYRPYVDTEEMINDFCERSGAKRSKMVEPFIWLKDGESRFLILDFEKDVVWTTNCHWSMQELLETYTYCDGSPIGKKE